jgi:hypothetical protein
MFVQQAAFSHDTVNSCRESFHVTVRRTSDMMGCLGGEPGVALARGVRLSLRRRIMELIDGCRADPVGWSKLDIRVAV